jgi:hypothetical protein
MRLPVIVLISLLIVSNTCAGWLTFGGKIHSDTTDTVTGVQSQQLVNVESGLTVVSSYTNGAALGATALQPPATNTLAAAAAHAATAHEVTGNGGFQGGIDASANLGGAVGANAQTTDGGAVGSGAQTTDGGAVGYGAHAEYGGAVGYGANTTSGGAVGYGAYTANGGAVGAYASAEYGGAVGSGANTMNGGAVGSSATTTDGGAVGSGAYTTEGGAVGASAYSMYGGAVGASATTTDGGAVGAYASAEYGGAVGSGASATAGGAVGQNARTSDGFAGGKEAFATTDGTYDGEGIDAIQLGTGGNTEPFSLQIYSNKLMHADGTIPVERFAATLNASNNADRAYADAAVNAAPEWIGITNLAAAVTITNSYERPVYLYSTGTVAVAFAGLRTPMPLYLVLRGPSSLTFPGAYYVGGGTWQTNMSNHFVVWKYGTNLFVNPVTATED